MKDECLICKAPLEYLEADELMECAICHRKENSKTRCVNGHYVCNECHTAGMDAIIGLCLSETSKNPFEIIEKMMSLPFCHMHGPEHHVMVGTALLTAYKNAGGDIDLAAALTEMMNRGKSVPGGACGFWGACGAGISSGMFVSIISKSTPLAMEPFALSHKMTAKSLGAIGEIGGPRCCKRDSYLSILSAIDFVKEHFGVEMEKPEIVCTHSAQNNQCIGKRCPFSKLESMERRDNMWTCPKCGKVLTREDQHHFCIKPETIDEYISQQADSVQPRLQAIRETIHAAIPEAQEKISWQMPTFWMGRNIIQFMAAKKHIGLYPGGEATEAFAERLADFDTSKGTIRLPHSRELPLELIRDIAIWCYEKYAKV